MSLRRREDTLGVLVLLATLACGVLGIFGAWMNASENQPQAAALSWIAAAIGFGSAANAIWRE